MECRHGKGLYEHSEKRAHLICDENGFAQTKDLPCGIYTVHQVKGWDGRELLPNFDVYIAKDGQTYRYLANNRNFESYIKIVKVDAETGKVIPLAGAGFRLYRPDGSLIMQTFTYPEVTTIDTFYTNSEGYLITPEKLEYGTGYSLVEVSAPYDYTLSGEPVYSDVTADNATEENAVTVVEAMKPNMAQKGVIKISKSGEAFSSVTEVDGLYQPVFSVRGLPGAVYEITAAEDIITPDGTLRASACEVVDTVTTDETGLAESKPLYLGKYEIREITAPGGYVRNTKIRTAELVYAGQEIENLRVGEYVVSEVSDGASSAYILPADKTASVFEGAVTKVEMHNELRDTPKTGDDSNPALWLSLLGISAVGTAVLGMIGLKKKQKEAELWFISSIRT